MKTDYNILPFKTINDFVKELSELFGSTNHSLKLYQRLLDKTTINHEKSIEKHIEIFRTFCVKNRDMILNKDISKLSHLDCKEIYCIYIEDMYLLFQPIFQYIFYEKYDHILI